MIRFLSFKDEIIAISQKNKDAIFKFKFQNFFFMHFSFSLAEMLIVIGMIGIISSVTIPSLVENYQDNAYKIAYKKAYSNASQALMEANQKGLISEIFLINDFTNNQQNFLSFMDQFNVAKKCIDIVNRECWDSSGEKYGKGWDSNGGAPYPDSHTYSFIDSSGMAWSMSFEGASRYFFVDTNGFKKPNQWGKDRFTFFLYDINNNYRLGIPIRVAPYPDNNINVCYGNKCQAELNYYSKTWLYN